MTRLPSEPLELYKLRDAYFLHQLDMIFRTQCPQARPAPDQEDQKARLRKPTFVDSCTGIMHSLCIPLMRCDAF